MSNKIEFGQDELEALIQLQNEMKALEAFRLGADKTIAELREEVRKQGILIQKMVWAGTKATLWAGGAFAGVTYIGYWLTGAKNFEAVKAFFRVLGEK